MALMAFITGSASGERKYRRLVSGSIWDRLCISPSWMHWRTVLALIISPSRLSLGKITQSIPISGKAALSTRL